ncbi:MAG TPA: hypothetical protein VFV38_23205 [Ktedonobacteraceae bacterium]|nr:hypothetical protein [Ktedonobacteraceae bacterium]
MIPRTFAPAPGWSSNGHRIKTPLEYSRGEEKVWISGALRVCDGKEITRRAPSRNSANYIELLKLIEADNLTGDIFIITDNLSSHNSLETRTWMADPRVYTMCSFPKERAGSICRRAGGGSFAAMPSQVRVLPIRVKSTWQGVWPQGNSTPVPNPGFGDGLPRRLDTIAVSFVTGFKERSTTGTLLTRDFVSF